jgi:hypothetical protein
VWVVVLGITFFSVVVVIVVVMALAVVEKSGLKRMREDVAPTHDGGEVDEDGASPPASKLQILDHPPPPPAGSVLDVAVNPRGGSSTCSNECVSAVTGGCGVEEEGPTGSTAVLRELEECLVADDEEQVGSSESSAVSEEENAARRVLRSLEQELGLSSESCEKGNQAAVSSINTPSAPPQPPSCTEAFAAGSCWADDMWNMHGFSSADLESVGCSTTSGSSLTTGDDDHLAVCDDSQFDVLLPMLNHHGSSSNDVVVPVVDMCNNMAAPGGGTVPPPVGVDETLESLQNSVSWALEEGFDDYSGFTDVAVGDEEWMTPVVDNLDFLLDSTIAYATTITAPFVEEPATTVGTSLI